MRYPKLRELKEAIRALIKGPYTSEFPYQPQKVPEKFRGRPYFYQEDCIGCGACKEVCPSGAIEIKDEVIKNLSAKRILTIHWDICIFCGQCEANCLTKKGIILSQEFDLATTGKREELKQVIEKELVLCECCNEVVAPLDQILWVARELGPLTFSNTSLMLFYLQNLELVLKEKNPPKEEMEFLRSDRIKILCPRCRREAILKS